ncbi:S-layer homology domain-containing protein, partial [Kocuria palustris]|uniref:S-layer homology domain-containing protein n=1 Tax=Kocuria palustris TaxID=71999 RepID=UPI0011A23B80
IDRNATAALLYRMSGSPAYTAPRTSAFTDVRPGSAFYKEIHWARAQGITTGWPDGTFRPLEQTDRDAMAAFLHRYEN